MHMMDPPALCAFELSHSRCQHDLRGSAALAFLFLLLGWRWVRHTGSDGTSGLTHGVTLPLISVLLICCTAHCSEKGILHSQSSGALLCHQVASANHQAVRPPAPPALSAPLKGRGDCHTGSDSTST